MRKMFVSSFVAPEGGEFFLGLNDVMIGVPGYGILRRFFANNSGTAVITIAKELPQKPPVK